MLWERSVGRGWDRKIKYSMKEYKDMYERVQELRERLEKEGGEGVGALELEKMAYVLGKEAEGAERYDVDVDREEGKSEVEVEASEGGKKRKAVSTSEKDSIERTNQPAEKKTKKTKKKGTTETN